MDVDEITHTKATIGEDVRLYNKNYLFYDDIVQFKLLY